jgi:hypothetical protein
VNQISTRLFSTPSTLFCDPLHYLDFSACLVEWESKGRRSCENQAWLERKWDEKTILEEDRNGDMVVGLVSCSLLLSLDNDNSSLSMLADELL